MTKILLTTDEPVATGDQLKPAAVEDVLAFEGWLQARAGASRLTTGEKIILMDYIYFKWAQSRS